MILGFSDATLAVVKRGGEEVREQGLLADHIGMSVCPLVHRFVDGGYEMEILSPAPSRTALEMISVFAKLSQHVWNRHSYRNWNDLWLIPLHNWIAKTQSTWLTKALWNLYPAEPTTGYCLIHGDPTMANLMIRNSHERVVTDPMPRMEYRREIPNLMEVDIGKLVQSAVGWERMLGCESSMWEEHDRFLYALPSAVREKSALWGAIHLARISVRAPGKGRHKIALWAQTMSKTLADSVLRGHYQ